MLDCDVLIFVDSTGKPDFREEILSPMISLDKLEGAVPIESDEATVDPDGDSGLDIRMFRGCWSISGLWIENGLILLVR